MRVQTINEKSFFSVCLVSLLICFAKDSEVRAQSRIPKLAMFQPGGTTYSAVLIDAFLAGLKDVGLSVGTDVIVDYYYARGRLDHFAPLARTVVASKSSVIVVASTPLTEAIMRETGEIPIVMAAAGDPVGSRLVASLARPGGNVTGTSMRSPEISGKRVQLIKELISAARRIVIFWNPRNTSHRATLEDSRAAANALNVALLPIPVQMPTELEIAFNRFPATNAGAFTLIRDPMFLSYRKQFVDFAAQKQVPAIYDGREFVLAGGLMSFTPDHLDLYRRAALHVKKILDGANPANLPVEQTRRTGFVVNLKAAKQIGLKIPPEMLTLADQVIE